MRGTQFVLSLVTLALAFGTEAGLIPAQASGQSPAQAQAAPPSQTPSVPAHSTTSSPRARSARHRRATPAQVASPQTPPQTPLPSAPSGQLTPAQQKEADQRLLLQQQKESERAAQINDEVVKKAQKQQDLQSVPRIQDGPPPSQNGVPAPGVPGQPVTTPPPSDSRIQDVPEPPRPVTPPQI